MKDVKVDVRVNVGVDAASVILLFASATAALFFYKQNKQEKLLNALKMRSPETMQLSESDVTS